VEGVRRESPVVPRTDVYSSRFRHESVKNVETGKTRFRSRVVNRICVNDSAAAAVRSDEFKIDLRRINQQLYQTLICARRSRPFAYYGEVESRLLDKPNADDGTGNFWPACTRDLTRKILVGPPGDRTAHLVRRNVWFLPTRPQPTIKRKRFYKMTTIAPVVRSSSLLGFSDNRQTV